MDTVHPGHLRFGGKNHTWLKATSVFLALSASNSKTSRLYICAGPWGLSQQPEIKTEFVCTLALHLSLRPGVSLLQQALER